VSRGRHRGLVGVTAKNLIGDTQYLLYATDPCSRIGGILSSFTGHYEMATLGVTAKLPLEPIFTW